MHPSQYHNRVAIMSSTASPVSEELPLRIGTRRSNLAMVQAEGIRNSLQKICPGRKFEIEALRTLGDKDQKTALYNFNAKSLWTAELEDKLNAGELDVVVHCLKGNMSCPQSKPEHLSDLKYPVVVYLQICLQRFQTHAN